MANKTVKPILVKQPGLLTTIQDLGRPSRLNMALSRGGAMDQAAMRLANALVGNPEDAAVLEVTGTAPVLFFEEPCCLAWTGAPFVAKVSIDGQTFEGLQSHRPVLVPKGSVIQWNPSRVGFRNWVAFSGGIDEPVILNSRSTHLAAGIGPGRLASGQRLGLGPTSESLTESILRQFEGLGHHRNGKMGLLKTEPQQPRWSIPLQVDSITLTATHQTHGVIPILAYKGPQHDWLSNTQKELLWSSIFIISAQSNRQGLRLEGQPLLIEGAGRMNSEAVRLGTIQLPPHGQPLLLLCEHQTTGGYPRIIEVCSSMERRLAQLKPGSRIQFMPTTLAESTERLAQIEKKREALSAAIFYQLKQSRLHV